MSLFHGCQTCQFCVLQGRHWVSIFEIDRWDSIVGSPQADTHSLDKEDNWLLGRYWFASPLSVRLGLSVRSASSIANRCESLQSSALGSLHGKLHLVFRRFMSTQFAQRLTLLIPKGSTSEEAWHVARALSCSDVIEPGRTRDSSISDDRSSVTLQRHRGHCNDYSGDGIARLQGFVGSSHCQARWISTEPVQTLARKTLDWLAIRVPFNALTIPRRLEAAWHRLACGGQHQPRYKTWSLQLWILLYPIERRCA